jgi:hypothetical protein
LIEIDRFSGFCLAQKQNTEQLVNKPWLKYIIVGGVIIVAVVTSLVVMTKKQPKINKKTNEDHEN